QSLYAAANAHLDALAQQRHTQGQPTTSIAWGVWGGKGMVELAPDGYLERHGLRPLRPETALIALQQALDHRDVNVTVADLDWDRFAPTLTARRPSPLIRDIPQARAARSATWGDAAQSGRAEGDEAVPRLKRARPEERPGLALQLVRGLAAKVLGHAGAAQVDARASFRDLGFDSLAAVSLRDGLAEATGLDLPAGLVFDHEDPASLADRLAELAGREATGASASPPPSNGTLLTALRTAVAGGRTEEAVSLMAGLAEFRPLFTGDGPVPELPAPVGLATGTARPRLYCCAGTAATSSPREYARFADALRDRREVTVLPLPGFGDPAEPLPASLDALLADRADALLKHCEGEPFALAGHSAGANVAHALAAYLEARGTGPAAVVLMDVYLPDDPGAMGVWRDDLLRWSLERSPVPPAEHRLTAMARYHRLLLGSHLTPLRAPVLLVRASEPLREWTGDDGPDGWRSRVPNATSVADVPGNHFTMLTDHAADTASAVHDWLASVSRTDRAEPTPEDTDVQR
ncbi:thioesterase domain-containing protein, partial [Streptomyces sp. NPDC052042]|uniref:thioesterase domain-containing protein n=1 Tax=Streptomyces sp. NPDC052042 TaxID=3365683 RepID=UPI0037D31FC0